MQSSPSTTVVILEPPGLPRDRGLSSLGLVMQLGGSFGMALAGMFFAIAVATVEPVFAALAMLAMARAWCQWSGGAALLYEPARARRATGSYAIVALFQTAITAGLLAAVAPVAAMTLAAVMLAWPVTLVLVLRSRWARPPLDAGSTVGEDLGFQGAAMLMTALGVGGVTLAFAAAALIGGTPLLLLASPYVVTTVLLAVRAVAELRCGWSGLRGEGGPPDVEDMRQRAMRFSYAAVVSGLMAAGAWAAGMTPPIGPLAAVGTGMLVGAFLVMWPLALRRFFQERCFALYLAGDRAEPVRRAPDGGVHALGWLMLAVGGMGLAAAVASALFGPMFQVDLAQVRALGGDAAVAAVDRSPWWSVGASALTVLVAVQLVRGAAHRGWTPMAYALVTLFVAGAVELPRVEALARCVTTEQGAGPGLMLYGVLAARIIVEVVLAVTVMVLTGRERVRAGALLGPLPRGRVRTTVKG
jgi:hypothetical protein